MREETRGVVINVETRVFCLDYEKPGYGFLEMARKRRSGMRRESLDIPHAHPVYRSIPTRKTHLQPSSYSALIPKNLGTIHVCLRACRLATRPSWPRIATDNSLTAVPSCKPCTWQRKDTIASLRSKRCRSLKLRLQMRDLVALYAVVAGRLPCQDLRHTPSQPTGWGDESECGVSASDSKNRRGLLTARYFWFQTALAVEIFRA
jgi:hypothetical protein